MNRYSAAGNIEEVLASARMAMSRLNLAVIASSGALLAILATSGPLIGDYIAGEDNDLDNRAYDLALAVSAVGLSTRFAAAYNAVPTDAPAQLVGLMSAEFSSDDLLRRATAAAPDMERVLVALRGRYATGDALAASIVNDLRELSDDNRTVFAVNVVAQRLCGIVDEQHDAIAAADATSEFWDGEPR